MPSRFRKPMVMEITGFDSQGMYVGSADWSFALSNWKCRTANAAYECQHEHEARDWLRSQGAVKLRDSDGRKY